MLKRVEREARMNNMEAAINELRDKLNDVVKNATINVNSTETADSATEQADKGVNGLLGSFFAGLETLGHYSGYEQLKEVCVRCFENAWVEAEETGEAEFSFMAAKKAVSQEIDKYIDFLKICFAEDDIMIINLFKESGLIDAFFGGAVNIVGIVTRKFRKLGAYIPKNKFFGAILKGAKVIAHAILTGAKFVFNVAKCAISFVGAGIMVAITLIRNAISALWAAIKDDSFDDDLDGFFEEEDINDEFDDYRAELDAEFGLNQ